MDALIETAAEHAEAIRAVSTLAHHAEAIRVLGKRAIKDIIEIGRRLTEVRHGIDGKPALLEHGEWMTWLEDEFDWKTSTADTFIRVYEASTKLANFANLNLPVSGFYALAAPSTPSEARAAIIEKATEEKLSLAEVKRMINEARKAQQEETADQREADRIKAEEKRQADLAKAEEKVDKLKASFEVREQKIRAEYEGMLTLDEVEDQIEQIIGPLKVKLERAEKRLERLQKPPSKRDKLGNKPVAIDIAMEHLAAALTIKPEQVIEHQQMITEATGQSMKAGLAQKIANAKQITVWLQRFLTLTEDVR